MKGVFSLSGHFPVPHAPPEHFFSVPPSPIKRRILCLHPMNPAVPCDGSKENDLEGMVCEFRGWVIRDMASPPLSWTQAMGALSQHGEHLLCRKPCAGQTMLEATQRQMPEEHWCPGCLGLPSLGTPCGYRRLQATLVPALKPPPEDAKEKREKLS